MASAPAPGRARLSGVSPLARASARSKPDDVAKIFKEVDTNADGVLSKEELLSYLGDYLGYGDREVSAFFEAHADAARGGVVDEGFQRGYASLNPYLITKREGALIVRKPGAVNAPGAQMNLENLTDCTVLICDKSEQVYVDECKNCRILVGPCAASVFVRDCQDCTFWIAARQLRTRDCKTCNFFLHSHTEPVIESSRDLGFAPFCASYPGLDQQIRAIGSEPARNFWSAIYDFTGRADGANWRILPVSECVELHVHLRGEAAPDSPWPLLTHELLCQAPPQNVDSAGASVANIPQTRPAIPACEAGAKPRKLFLNDTDGEVSAESVAGTEKKAESKGVVDVEGKEKRKLRKPKWITVSKITPDLGGINLFAKVVKTTSLPSAHGAGGDDAVAADVVIGDSSGLVTVRARGHAQVEACQPGRIIRIQNAKAIIVKGFIRVSVSKWGVLKPAPTDHEDIEPKLTKDISAVEYELA